MIARVKYNMMERNVFILAAKHARELINLHAGTCSRIRVISHTFAPIAVAPSVLKAKSISVRGCRNDVRECV